MPHDLPSSHRIHLVEIPRFNDEARRRLREQLLDKGGQIAALLADVLAGEDRDGQLRALPLDAKPGERPEERLRRFLDLIESRRILLDERNDRYGRCDVCGADLGMPALGQMPWADHCNEHVAGMTR
jgi:hypothetical protein